MRPFLLPLLLPVKAWDEMLAASNNRRLTQLNLELEQLSVTNKLTGLFNRVKLDVVLSGEIDRAARVGQPFCVFIIDIDHYTQGNDQHGHQVGDQVLEQMAQVLIQNTRKIDTAGRWGGEEFLIICPNTDSVGGQQLAVNLRNIIAQTELPMVGNKTVSIGLNSFQTNDAAEDIVAHADGALYAAKNGGRTRVEVG